MNSPRVAPPPDVYASCPSDGKILGYYEGQFESVYVLVHPFLRLKKRSADAAKTVDFANRKSVAENCESVSWSEVISLTGLPSISAVDIGLRTTIRALRKEFCNEDYAKKIFMLEETYGIYGPSEGYFSDLLHNTVMQFFQDNGYQWAWVGDEFCTERKLYWIDDLKSKHADAKLGHCSVFTPDKLILYTTHWDSHFSFLCAPRKIIRRIVDSGDFEGFACTADTQVYWSTQVNRESLLQGEHCPPPFSLRSAENVLTRGCRNCPQRAITLLRRTTKAPIICSRLRKRSVIR